MLDAGLASSSTLRQPRTFERKPDSPQPLANVRVNPRLETSDSPPLMTNARVKSQRDLATCDSPPPLTSLRVNSRWDLANCDSRRNGIDRDSVDVTPKHTVVSNSHEELTHPNISSNEPGHGEVARRAAMIGTETNLQDFFREWRSCAARSHSQDRNRRILSDSSESS